MRMFVMLALGTSVVASATEPPSARAALTEASCSFMLSVEDETPEFVGVPGLSVLHPSPAHPQLHVELEDGASLDGVVCWRSSALIGPKDDWVARTGVPLYIKQDDDAPDNPTLVLELTEPGYRVRVVAGPALSPDEAERTVSLIETFNRRREDRTDNTSK